MILTVVAGAAVATIGIGWSTPLYAGCVLAAVTASDYGAVAGLIGVLTIRGIEVKAQKTLYAPTVSDWRYFMVSGRNLQCLIGLHRFAIVADDNPEFLNEQHQECTRCGKTKEIHLQQPPPPPILPSVNSGP